MDDIAVVKRHHETGIRLLANLTGAAGFIAALFWVYLAFEPRTVSVPGGFPVTVSVAPKLLLLVVAAAYLVAGLTAAFLISKFASALELMHEIRASIKR